MRKYKYNGIVESLKTKPNEITISEFEKISKLQEKYSGNFLYYLDTFQILGLSESFTDAIDDQTLFLIIKEFQRDFKVKKDSYKQEIEIDGYTYRAYDDKFKISARDFADIEERMHKNNFDWLAYAFAVIFKRTDLSDVEHKTSAHREHKEKLFKELTMDIALPYIMYISESYIDNIKILAND